MIEFEIRKQVGRTVSFERFRVSNDNEDLVKQLAYRLSSLRADGQQFPQKKVAWFDPKREGASKIKC